jgi:dihydrofolate reductase
MLRAIAALNGSRLIGQHNGIPWHYPEDLKRFKRLTVGSSIIMGRRTWDSLSIKPLPGRKNVVLTTDVCSAHKVELAGGVGVLSDHVATEVAGADAWVIGGAKIYQTFWPMIDRLYLTIVPDVPAASTTDVYFPYWDPKKWETVESSESQPLKFLTLHRRKAD